VRQAKLQSVAALHGRPVSSPAQYMPWPLVDTQIVPALHPPVELHVRVQRWTRSPGNSGRQISGEAQSPSEVHGSSSCSFIVPPLVLLLVVGPLVLLVVLLVLVTLVLVVLVTPVVVDEAVVAPDEPDEPDDEPGPGPVPPVLVVGPTPPAPPVLDDDPPPPEGTHCAF
jgi:hypothetical protein